MLVERADVASQDQHAAGFDPRLDGLELRVRDGQGVEHEVQAELALGEQAGGDLVIGDELVLQADVFQRPHHAGIEPGPAGLLEDVVIADDRADAERRLGEMDADGVVVTFTTVISSKDCEFKLENNDAIKIARMVRLFFIVFWY